MESALTRLMPGPSFGVMMPTEFPLQVGSGEEVIAAAKLADERGVDALWVGDHIMFHSPILDCLSVLAMLAGVTKNPVLASGVLIAPLRHPVLLAKAAATIDHLSGGRFVLGLGVGGEAPGEFAATDTRLQGRGKRTDAMIEVLRDLLSGKPATAGPEVGGFRDVRLEPASFQRDGPPILVGGRSDAALARAGRVGDGWIGYFVSPDRFQRSWKAIVQHATQAGRDPSALLPAVLIFCAVDDDEAEARRVGDEWLGAQFGLPPETLRRYCITGTPQQVAEQVTRWMDVGARHLVLGCAGSVPAEQVAAVAEGVIPLLRRSVT